MTLIAVPLFEYNMSLVSMGLCLYLFHKKNRKQTSEGTFIQRVEKLSIKWTDRTALWNLLSALLRTRPLG